MDKIRLLLLDDHELFREGLVRLLATEDAFELVAQCSTSEQAFSLIGHRAIDLVLLDFDLGDDTGLRFIVAALAAGYTGKILLVAAGISPIDAGLLQQHGISGIFLKHGSPASLLDAIYTVARGGRWIDPKVEDDASIQFHPRETTRTSDLLTSREQQVLRCVFEGLINKQIAVRIGVSQSSVKATLQQLFDKTGVRTRSQLVRFAIERSLETERDMGKPEFLKESR
jgi:DNA-binding NarL/FixJ family response regulator